MTDVERSGKGGTKIEFVSSWLSEPDAGIRGGSEVVTIHFSTGFQDGPPEEVIEGLREALAEIYDGACIETMDEYNESLAKEKEVCQ